MNSHRIRCKVWLEVDGEALLGRGRERLLNAIAEHGSISAAARALDLSYRKVWAQIREMERVAPFTLLVRRTGGRDGGATELTAEARQLLEQYRQLEQKIDAAVDQVCQQERFADILFSSDVPPAP